MKNKLTKNYIYMLAYQVLTVITPFFTTPYVSRVLGLKAIGIDAYISSYVQLFLILIILGLPTYAAKTIAQVNKSEENKVVSELLSIQLILTVATTFFYLLFCILYKKNQLLLLLYSLTLVSTGIDTSWYFVGKERISNIMIRNISVKIVTVFSIFLFVNTNEDLWKFILINGSSLLLGQIVTGSIMIKEIEKVRFFKPIRKHIVPILILFIVPCMLAVSLSLNKILLERWNGEIQVGIYNQAQKLYVIVISFISALSSVMMPRMSRYFTNKNHDEMKKYLNFSIRFIIASSLPLTVGVIMISNQFIPWFLGENFKSVSSVMMIIALCFVVKGLVDILGIQYLVIANKNMQYVLAITIGSIVSITSCYISLLLGYQAKAPAIGLLIGTIVTLIIEMLFCMEIFSFTFYLKCMIKYTAFSVLMGAGIFFANKIIFIKNVTFSLFFQLIVGVIIYGCILIISNDPMIKIIKMRRVN